MTKPDKSKANRYKAILAKIFEDRYTAGATEVPFSMAGSVSGVLNPPL
jgi:hypothetical protein